MKKGITGLRGIFMLTIVLFHVHAVFGEAFQHTLGFFYVHGGNFGNSFFFMISGFLIAMHYKGKIMKKEISLETFLGKHISKWYSIYLVTDFTSIAFAVINGGMPAFQMKQLLLDVCLISTGWVKDGLPYNVPAWFLCLLVLCYGLYYFVCSCGRRSDTIYRVIIIGFILLGIYIMENDFSIPFCYEKNGEAYLNFFIGVLLFELYISEYAEKITILLNGIFILVVLDHFLNPGAQLGMFVVAVGIVSGVIWNTVNFEIVDKVFGNLLFVWLGKIALSICLWHIPLVSLFWLLEIQERLCKGNGHWAMLFYFVLLFAIAEVSQVILEKRKSLPWVKV